MTTPSPAPTSLMANAIRALSMDAVQKANSGHPGMPMGMAEIGVALWSRHLRHNPKNPQWADRDRFILSNGHGSMLLYSLLHLTGYDLPMEELKNFRQMHSKTPGHPEYGITPGVETTTGPLGQGLANAVGMALAESLLATEFNKSDAKIVDHHTYVFVGDGCLMEGISHEACSLAGVLKLNKLIAFYDDNGISIDGEVVHWFHDDTPKRFEAYGWNVIPNVLGHDVDAVDAAIKQAKQSDKPTLICCKTVIGEGAPTKAGSHDSHGSPLGDKEIAATREAIGWKWEPFVIPQEVYAAWDATEAGARNESDWDKAFAAYAAKYPQEAAEFKRRDAKQLPADWKEKAQAIIAGANERKETVATRKASQQAIEGLSAVLPELLGGSADLTGSNLTNWKAAKPVRVNAEGKAAGNYVNYGVREFGMSAAINGMALHGGFKAFGGTFLTFSDYSRNALRVAALMKAPSIFVFTHDSIGLGEDGPTHQSIEHVASLRLIPNLQVWRPADTVETAVAWTHAVEYHGPSCLIFSRQNLPFSERTDAQIANIEKGGYVLRDWNDEIVARKIILIATGSEVELALNAVEPLAREGIAARVVSMPSTNVFDKQDAEYRERVLPKGVRRVAIEAGVTDFWRKYVGLEGGVVGIDTFGESAPAGVLFKHFGFTVEHVVETAKAALG
ncbi:Transketolase 1 [Paraburkholderia domus]|uniref:Transketolase n=1 Tax=Paraburkholderia domus TaxID=2793075 RepID=A0A9N8N0G0_9BURK|nr:transketolase [Paraburkholderia domus]MBK5050670.1 transketolase [Burkholderia sp. R-70006]MBK5059450.1 transketolase [Burkholderia sp. R-70199]MBK5086944.1 transketolase [Burkholderia sp. R-69927]MBK5119542.1 transketolase [Burkholderia sp. R-69980]MBK5167591.1 transketolase [Burkholderia sp. R-70211]MBK5183107.1 transketolase [Burkholderia sp. R-69749]MCI0145607.1 transketolase [Paraburkholderia sediminicola]